MSDQSDCGVGGGTTGPTGYLQSWFKCKVWEHEFRNSEVETGSSGKE